MDSLTSSNRHLSEDSQAFLKLLCIRDLSQRLMATDTFWDSHPAPISMAGADISGMNLSLLNLTKLVDLDKIVAHENVVVSKGTQVSRRATALLKDPGPLLEDELLSLRTGSNTTALWLQQLMQVADKEGGTGYAVWKSGQAMECAKPETVFNATEIERIARITPQNKLR